VYYPFPVHLPPTGLVPEDEDTYSSDAGPVCVSIGSAHAEEARVKLGDLLSRAHRGVPRERGRDIVTRIATPRSTANTTGGNHHFIPARAAMRLRYDVSHHEHLSPLLTNPRQLDPRKDRSLVSRSH